MARRVPPPNPAADAPLAPGAADPNAAPPAPALPGGTSGVLIPPGSDLLPGATRKIYFPGEAFGTAAPPTDPAPSVRVERFVVQNCPRPAGGTPGFRVVLNGTICHMVDGKIVDSTMYDLDALRKQGVDLKFIGAVGGEDEEDATKVA